MKTVKQVLIAHQSTIPHYRVAFYEALERIRPDWWEFRVAFDPEAHRRFFSEPIDPNLSFPLVKTSTFSVRAKNRMVSLQTFLWDARKYDLIVAEHALNNLSYPLSQLHRLLGKKFAYWGHGRDYLVPIPTGLKRHVERFKLWLARHADGYFAYTPGVRDYLVQQGLDAESVFTLNNTVDIEAHRRVHNTLSNQRDALRERMGLGGKKVLLYVGRLRRGKRIEVLLDAFRVLWERDHTYHLMVVGGGDRNFVKLIEGTCGPGAVTYHGVVTDPQELGPIFLASDLYTFPGVVGLGPLNALCYDLTPVLIDGPIHMPEYEYLSAENAVILPKSTTVDEYADAIDSLMRDPERVRVLRSNAWSSIRHLTIENMARNFADGVSALLKGAR